MCDHILRRTIIHFCRCCLQAFTTEKILKRHSKGCFKINGKQITIMSKEGGKKLKIMKSPFIIYADFESVLVSEDNEKQNPVLYKQISKTYCL